MGGLANLFKKKPIEIEPANYSQAKQYDGKNRLQQKKQKADEEHEIRQVADADSYNPRN